MVNKKTKVVMKIKVSSQFFRAYVDEHRVRFENGEAALDMEPKDKDYVLTWFIRDVPGTKYGIQIAEPERAKMTYAATLDASGKDAGIYWFKI
jgi:hypothetical protein